MAPKKREIVSIAFRDRVYQRSLNDNAIYPQMTKGFINTNVACQKGKGTDLARETLKKYLRAMYRKYGKNFNVLQCDIHGYYPNMQHETARQTFRKGLEPHIYQRADRVLTNQYAGEIGYNPGSQMIQIAGISVLSPIDHFIKERLHIKYYIRYMDDFILLHESTQYLEYCKQEIDKHLRVMGFEFNPKKTHVYSVGKCIPFLGFNFKLDDKGKVIMLLKSDNVKRERKKLQRLVNKCKRGEITKEKVNVCYAGWRVHAEKGDSTHLLDRMDKYYKDLWKGAK